MRAIATLAAVAAALSIAAPCPAAAQGMDYGAFEELFGESVTTSANGSPQRPSDVPANMEIVTAEMIRRSGASDIPGVLAHVVGVDVLRWGTTAADVSVRGYDTPFSPRLLVLVNGRQVYLDDWGRTQWDAIPVQLAEIRQIEVVKGPNSALFGFNAASGVINIITYNPLYDSVNTATLAGGTQAFGQASVVGTARLGEDASVRLSAGGFHSDEFARLRETAQQLGLKPQAWQGALSADALVRIGADQEFELEATHSALSHLEATTVWAPVGATYDLSSIKGRYGATTGIGQIEAVAYTNFVNESAQFAGQVLGLQNVALNNQKTVVQVQDVFKAGADHTFRVSAEYQHSMIDTAPLGGATVGYDIASASAMWQWQILPELSLTEAARADVLWLHRFGDTAAESPLTNAQWNRRIVEPSYNVGLVYRPRDSDTLRLIAARGVQLPSLIGFGALQFTAPPLFVSGVPTINPTVVTNYELDWDHRLPAINTVARAALFYQTNTSLQTITSGVIVPLELGFLFNGPGNVGNSDEFGIELSAKGTLPGGWHWNAGYSPRLVQDHFLPDQPPALTGVDFAHTTPRHVIDLGGGWSNETWEIDAAARFQSTFDGFVVSQEAIFTPTRVHAYLTVDARVAYKVTPAVTVSLVGRGITMSTQQQTAIGTVDRRVLAVLQATF